MARPTNWAGNVTYQARGIAYPSSVAELRSVVAHADRVRPLGTRHSFNDLADSPGVLVSLDRLPPAIEVDTAAARVRVAAGVRYAELARRVDEHGLALPNLASLPHLGVAGACATASHGSGVANRCLAASVAELELVTAGGELVTVRRAVDPRFAGMVVGLGALGVVVALTLDLVPAYAVRQEVYERLPLEAAAAHFAELVGCAYSVSLFTDWRGPELTQIWVKQRLDQPEPAAPGAGWFTAAPAAAPRHPAGLSPGGCTVQLGVPGPWYERLPHFRPDAVPSSGRELQSEYMLDRADAVAALAALDRVRDRIHPVLQVCEIRTVAADELWLSPCYRRDTVSVHFTWVDDAPAVLPVVALVEERLAAFSPRPHWGKVFTTPAGVLRSRYERLPEFRELMYEHDPAGKFGNAWLDRCLGEEGHDRVAS